MYVVSMASNGNLMQCNMCSYCVCQLMAGISNYLYSNGLSCISKWPMANPIVCGPRREMASIQKVMTSAQAQLMQYLLSGWQWLICVWPMCNVVAVAYSLVSVMAHQPMCSLMAES